MVQALQPLIVAADARVDVGPLPAVTGDARQLERVFDNVIGNALKFHSDEPPKVIVEGSRSGDLCHFVVADNGVGIAADQRERACEMFQRLVPDMSPRARGWAWRSASRSWSATAGDSGWMPRRAGVPRCTSNCPPEAIRERRIDGGGEP